jgi:hypothetical protein
MTIAQRRAALWASKKEPWTFNEITTSMWLDFSNPARRNIIGGRFQSITDVKLTPGVVLSESNASTRPRLDTQINGRDVARFDSDGLFNNSLQLPLNNYTIYMVVPSLAPVGGPGGPISLRNSNNFDSEGGNGMAVTRDNNPNGVTLEAGPKTFSASPVDAVNVFQIRIEGTGVQLTTNGKQLVTGTTNTTVPQSLGGVALGYRYFGGLNNFNVVLQLCEIVWVPFAVDTDTGLRSVGQLAHKWGAQGFLPLAHPYKAAPPTL